MEAKDWVARLAWGRLVWVIPFGGPGEFQEGHVLQNRWGLGWVRACAVWQEGWPHPCPCRTSALHALHALRAAMVGHGPCTPLPARAGKAFSFAYFFRNQLALLHTVMDQACGPGGGGVAGWPRVHPPEQWAPALQWQPVSPCLK